MLRCGLTRTLDARVRLEAPSARREPEYLAAAVRSRALHRGYVLTATTAADYRAYLARSRRDCQQSFFVIEATSDELAGVIDINDIVRGREPSGRLGYYAFVPHAGKGLMREGLALAIERAFHELGLQRLEAAVQPRNRRSAALVERLAFGRDGSARTYLKIGSRWLDHERWTLYKREGSLRPDQALERRA